MVWELTPRTGGNHSVGSNLDVVIYLFIALSLYLFSVYFFFRHIFAHWLLSPYSHCGPFTASRDFCNNVFLVLTNNSSPRHSTSAECECSWFSTMETRRMTIMQPEGSHEQP